MNGLQKETDDISKEMKESKSKLEMEQQNVDEKKEALASLKNEEKLARRQREIDLEDLNKHIEDATKVLVLIVTIVLCGNFLSFYFRLSKNSWKMRKQLDQPEPTRS